MVTPWVYTTLVTQKRTTVIITITTLRYFFTYVYHFSLIVYINETLIPTVHAMAWYYPFFVQDPGQMVDYNNKFLGVVRIRQHRKPNNSCPLPDLARKLYATCVAEFSDGKYVYKQNFEEEWQLKLFHEIEPNRLEHFWNYDTSGTSVTGKLSLQICYTALFSVTPTVYHSHTRSFNFCRKECKYGLLLNW